MIVFQFESMKKFREGHNSYTVPSITNFTFIEWVNQLIVQRDLEVVGLYFKGLKYENVNMY